MTPGQPTGPSGAEPVDECRTDGSVVDEHATREYLAGAGSGRSNVVE
ncbi:hypothetical protein HQO85_06190 [Rhodococcus fascians]|nr:hypothetical protein [Rhodococcus fascians]